MKKLITCLTLILLTTACGWHLRGSVTGDDKLALATPIDLVIKTNDNHSPLLNELRKSLRNYKITEVSSGSTNGLELQVGPEVMDKRTAGVGSDALTSAYELIISVEYTLKNSEGQLTPFKTRATQSRTYNYNVNNASGATQEEALVLDEMRRDLAQQLLRRVKALNNNPIVIPADSQAK